jgi:hypothetical protein
VTSPDPCVLMVRGPKTPSLRHVGPKAAAEQVKRSISHTRTLYTLIVDDYGFVRVRPVKKPYRVPVKEEWIVGYFNHRATVGDLLEALTERLQEIGGMAPS